MTKRELVNALISEMENFGETFIGTAEVQGTAVVNLYKKLNKEIGKRNPGAVVCWNAESGMAWIA